MARDTVTKAMLAQNDKHMDNLLRELEEAQREVCRIEAAMTLAQNETDLIRSQIYFIQFQDESIDEALYNQEVAYNSVDEAKQDAEGIAESVETYQGLTFKIRCYMWPFETKFEGKTSRNETNKVVSK